MYLHSPSQVALFFIYNTSPPINLGAPSGGRLFLSPFSLLYHCPVIKSFFPPLVSCFKSYPETVFPDLYKFQLRSLFLNLQPRSFFSLCSFSLATRPPRSPFLVLIIWSSSGPPHRRPFRFFFLPVTDPLTRVLLFPRPPIN